MITGELKRQVDKIWDTLWTAGITSPVTVMEQITYLLFMKLLDDSQLARESNANAFGTAVQDPVFKGGVCVISEQPRIECEYDRLRWSRFSNANPPEMFETVRNYVFEFIKRLGGDEDDTAFGRYMKNAVFLIPTPEVLVSVVGDMSSMQLTDKDTMDMGQDHSVTDDVWFYDMKADGFSLDDKRSPIAENDIPDVIEKFHARNPEEPSDRKAKCFFVPKSEIAENDYDLSINKYKTVEYVAEKFPPVSEIMAEFEKTEREIQATFAELKEML